MNNYNSINQHFNNYLEIDSNLSETLNESFNSYTRLGHNKNDDTLVFPTSNLTYEPWLTVIIAIVATLMSSITIIGNVFVITAFIIDKNLRKYSNYFILNLSIADLLIGVLIPPYAPFMLNKRSWSFGKFACTVWLVLDYVVGSASVLCIVVISLDRFLLVSRGLKYVSGQKVPKAILIMLTVWFIAFFNYAPAIIFWEIISGRQTVKEGECQVAFHDNLVYLTATACVEFFAPLISICGLNIAVYLNIRKRSRGLIRTENPHFNKNTVKNVKKIIEVAEENLDKKPSICIEEERKKKISIHSASSSASSSSEDLDKCKDLKDETNKNLNECSLLLNDYEENQKRIKSKSLVSLALESNHNACTSILVVNKPVSNNNNSNVSYYVKPKKTQTGNRTLTKDKKAARSLFILVFVFVFCWAPYTFLTLIKAVWPNVINEHAYELTFWLLWFNSTLNPILYPFLHVKFRKAFLKIIQYILFCFKFKKKGYTQAVNNRHNLHSNAPSNFKKHEKTPSFI